MCLDFINNATPYQRLARIDRRMADEVQASGCPFCGDKLHSACYPRKPRGLQTLLANTDSSRFSFCCKRDDCRRRTTPPSVRFLGRKVYLGAIVVLLTALHHGLTPTRKQALIEQLDVSQQTLSRWRKWWLETFPASRCWQAETGNFIPPIDTTQLPGALLARLASPDGATRVTYLLLLLAPITTTSSDYLPVGLDPQKM